VLFLAQKWRVSCFKRLQWFWELEKIRAVSQTQSSEEQAVLHHYQDNHYNTKE